MTTVTTKEYKFISCNATSAVSEEVLSALALLGYVKHTNLMVVQSAYGAFNALLGNHLLNIHYNLRRMTQNGPETPEVCRTYFPSKNEATLMETRLMAAHAAVNDEWMWSNNNPDYHQAARIQLHKVTEMMYDLVAPKE